MRAPLLLLLLAASAPPPSSALTLQSMTQAVARRLSAFGDAASTRLRTAAQRVSGTVTRRAGHGGQGRAADRPDGASVSQMLSSALGIGDLIAASKVACKTKEPAPLAAEATMTADQLIQHWGYPGERHSIPTEDGYLLTLQRVPWSRGRGRGGEDLGGGEARPPVLVQHGLMQSAEQWLLRGPDQDLVFLLSDLGYDVWLGNFRGNTYSKSHLTLNKDSERFWDFSWHENGYFDLAASIDYVLAVSGAPSLAYVGHSMGTTALLVLLATRPEYNRRVRVASMLAPVAYFSRPRGVASMLLPVARKIERDVHNLHVEVMPAGTLPLNAISALCRPGTPTVGLCMAAYSQTAGPDPRQMNATLFPTMMAHMPAGASLGQFVHYAQVHKSGVFRQYDHGVRGNTLRYGQAQPPVYNLTNVVAPILFHYSAGDYLAHPKDVERLISEVAGTAGAYKVPWKEFNHGDYMWAVDSHDLLFRTVLKTMRDF